jgi:hypothetical protein
VTYRDSRTHDAIRGLKLKNYASSKRAQNVVPQDIQAGKSLRSVSQQFAIFPPSSSSFVIPRTHKAVAIPKGYRREDRTLSGDKIELFTPSRVCKRHSVLRYCGKFMRLRNCSKRSSERSRSDSGATLDQTSEASRCSCAFSNHPNASSISPSAA